MEISIPTWNSESQSYTFRILKTEAFVEDTVYFDKVTNQVTLPVSTQSVCKGVVVEFLEKSKKYFTNPLTPEKVYRHLRHEVYLQSSLLPQESNWYIFYWKPYSLTLKAGDFLLTWELHKVAETQPLIPATFTESTTPRAQSPNVPEQVSEVLRNIQIRDSLIPVGDLPLSDLPPLAFGTEEMDPDREESRRRIREARLKVQLAKLKAQRMEHKYYERYGQPAENSEGSSEVSSESEEETLSFGRHSHS
jgi:hypothetical protein